MAEPESLRTEHLTRLLDSCVSSPAPGETLTMEQYLGALERFAPPGWWWSDKEGTKLGG